MSWCVGGSRELIGSCKNGYEGIERSSHVWLRAMDRLISLTVEDRKNVDMNENDQLNDKVFVVQNPLRILRACLSETEQGGVVG